MDTNVSNNLKKLEQKMLELKDSTSEDALSETLEELSTSIEEMHAAEAELIEANKRLEEERWRYKELFDFAPDAYLVTNLYGIIKEANRAASALLKVSPDMVVGKPLQVFVDKKDIDVFRTNIELLRQGKDVPGWEARIVPRSGSPLTVAVSVNPNREPDASLTGLRFMLHDMAEAKKVEAELRFARDAAEEAVKVKAAFMANMSHEFRTPMNAVIGMTSILLEEPLTDEQREFVEIIRKGGDALMSLVNEVLDFSRIDRDEAELELQPFNLRDCIEESLDISASAAAAKGLELAYVFRSGTPESIIGDPARLRQILTNLISNAVKFTEIGEVVVYVSKGPTAGELTFAVSDTGIGIPEDQLSWLFLPFTQLEMSLSRGYEGTGLGLAISRRLVEMMDGKICVDSVEGKGSTFVFTIRAKVAESDPGPFLSGRFEGRHVLIVEGNETLMGILCSQAGEWGLLPDKTATSKEAAGWWEENMAALPDLVIMDTNVSGWADLARNIRKSCNNLPLLLLTTIGEHLPPDISVPSLNKPVKPGHLYDSIRHLLAENGALPKGADSRESISHGPTSILLAEDNYSNQKVTLQMLKKLGYRADAVSSGLEALDALERQRYDVVLMDVRMPQMNGLEASRAIRKRFPSDRQPKIIALTAYALAGDREKCLDASMDDYLSKPVKIEELSEMLEKHRKEGE